MDSGGPRAADGDPGAAADAPPPVRVHAVWVPAESPAAGALLLWGEQIGAAPTAPQGAAAGVTAPRHPFAAPEAALRAALAAGGGLPPPPDRSGAWLPAVPLLLPGTIAAGPTPSWAPAPAAGAPPVPRPWAVGALALDPAAALRFLLRRGPGGPALGGAPDLDYWVAAARLAAAILAGGRYLPAFRATADGAWATWEPGMTDPADRAAAALLAGAQPPAARAATPAVPAAALLDSFLAATVSAAVRAWGAPDLLPAPPAATAPPARQAAYEWLLALLGPDPQIAAPPAAWPAFARQYRAWGEGRQPPVGAPAFRVCFRLEPPADPGTPWRLHFLLQATDDLSLLLPAADVWRMPVRPPPGAGLQGRDAARLPERLRAGLAGAGRLFTPIADALQHPAPIHCALDTAGAYAFLREAAPLLAGAGYGVLVPPWWGRRESRPALRVQVAEAAPAADGAGARAAGPGLLGADALVDFDWQVALGETVVDRAEFERLVALKTPLVNVRGQWVEFRPGEVEAALRFWIAQAARGPQPLGAVARLLLAAGTGAGAALPVAEEAGVTASPAVTAALAVLRECGAAPDLPPPPGLQATLRPYQVRGYSWLAGMRRLGLGACLADDMGLGKTVQTLALLLHARGAGPALLICPTSLVGNWAREAARFAPTLRLRVHQGPDRAAGPAFAAAARAHDLVITSYSLLARDETTLAGVAWAGLVLDEAQNIKNPDAAGTRAAKRLPAGYRVALTGTPVENRLEELWSILDFLNPGYLGARAAFRAQYALPIEREGDPAATAALRARVGPLILRRLKTDRTIIADLPEKLERKVYCPLTPEQATLYEVVVRAGLAALGSKAGMARRGGVLRLLLHLKQIADHPALFLGDGSALPGRSGKLARLTEMLAVALAAGDKALVFTQFATMGALLQAHLTATLGGPVLYLHGGTPRPERDSLVAAFQAPSGPRLLVLSIKAGGTGLTLTAANHVVHFDRWWNPAVENQATDRAFRIGQRKDVQVHKLIAAGTLEERIDALIESKRALAAGLGAGETALADLDDAALAALVALDAGAGGWELADADADAEEAAGPRKALR